MSTQPAEQPQQPDSTGPRLDERTGLPMDTWRIAGTSIYQPWPGVWRGRRRHGRR